MWTGEAVRFLGVDDPMAPSRTTMGPEEMVDRFKLLFGPYRTPRFRYGDVVFCEMRGEVKIVGLTNGPIAER
jgi:hypothetical protein